MKKVTIFDSTLRDGMQAEGIAFSVEDKLNIAHALDELGVHYVEAGNPGSNPKDMEFFRRAAGDPLKNAVLCAFGSTRRKNIKPQDDANLTSLLSANTPAVSIFGKCWDLHVEKVINTTLEENLRMIEDTIAYMKAHGKEVIFDAEHFFDGYKANPAYAMDALGAAVAGGADVVCLCDTNGGTYPTDIFGITKTAVERFPEVAVGIHCHEDTGMATAQSLFAVDAGACQVQGTFIGFGERCGNANLSTIIADLQLKRGVHCLSEEKLTLLTETARRIAGIANKWLPSSMPYVGSSAFAHKGGMHIDGVKKVSESFEHIAPEAVGNSRRYLMSEVSGKSTLLKLAQKVDPGITSKDPVLAEMVAELKQREYNGYQYEAAEESFELLVRHMLGRREEFYELDYFKIISEQPSEGKENPASAMVKVRVNGESRITAAEGEGPVNALDKALRGALEQFYPQLGKMRLTDYKVRVLEGSDATASKVRVLIESSDGVKSWNTVGVSTDIIGASFKALGDSIEYMLTTG